jgi:hypothetical protein
LPDPENSNMAGCIASLAAFGDEIFLERSISDAYFGF